MTHYLIILLFISSVSSRRAKYGQIRSSAQSQDDCDVSKEEAIDALQELFLVGDEDMLLPNDHCEILDHCDKVEELARKKLAHIKCLTNENRAVKFFYNAVAKGYIRENQKRCSNKEWREKFLEFSKCVRRSTAAVDIHKCAYKTAGALKYALDNFGVDHQLQFGCCAYQLIGPCIHTQLVKDCGDEIAEYGTELVLAPHRDAVVAVCPEIDSLQQCRKMYPEDMKEVEKIFASKKIPPYRNYLAFGYEIFENRGERLPEYVPVADEHTLA